MVDRRANSGTSGGNRRSAARPTSSFGSVLRAKSKQPQFYWFLANAFCLYYYVQYMLSFREHSIKTNHRKILICMVISYGIVLHQYVKSKQLTFQWANLKQQIRQLDNLQYFTLSVVLLTCSLGGGKTLSGTESSMAIYSLFHALNYFKENVLPFIPINPMLKGSLSNKITSFITTYNAAFFQVAVSLELGAMFKWFPTLPIRLLVLLVRFDASSLFTLLSIWTYATFFKLRYNQSEQMRILCNERQVALEQLIATRVPALMDKYLGVKHLAKVFFDRIPAWITKNHVFVLYIWLYSFIHLVYHLPDSWAKTYWVVQTFPFSVLLTFLWIPLLLPVVVLFNMRGGLQWVAIGFLYITWSWCFVESLSLEEIANFKTKRQLTTPASYLT